MPGSRIGAEFKSLSEQLLYGQVVLTDCTVNIKTDMCAEFLCESKKIGVECSGKEYTTSRGLNDRYCAVSLDRNDRLI